MDTGVVRSPLPSYTAITPEARAEQRNAPATKTEIAPSKTVPPSEDTQSGRTAAEDRKAEPVGGQQVRELVRKNKLDPESQSLIYVAMDQESGEVVNQVPSETLRKLRAYARSVDAQAGEQPKSTVMRTA
ncbi:hypothetical protein GWI72_02675 [Microvirga tunisiensis]|uniref:Uncharacterized protein n=2 Tax=Pannonibacter tanglangensis TaxID=2750084 RepID=A0A7X5EZU2_9HYPH|nr:MULTISPECIES: hypothetical protein [unclassified Pannonibacter]NBN63531.1 hypothetical protein [Pannonibacter sp. XCT-34]NBN77168.1 hypothetical protein [Pannonibacter sp. XCT-53]